MAYSESKQIISLEFGLTARFLLHVLTALSGAGADDITIPEGAQSGVLAVMQKTLADYSSELQQHGCWCSYAVDSNENVGGAHGIDTLDTLCKRWFAARACTELPDGECHNDWDDSYVFSNGTSLTCSNGANDRVCDVATCAIDLHYRNMIDTEITRLLGANGAFTASFPSSPCTGVTAGGGAPGPNAGENQQDRADIVTSNITYCLGDAPNVHKNETFQTGYSACIGTMTLNQVLHDSCRAIQETHPLQVRFIFKNDSTYDTWTVYHYDYAGAANNMGTYSGDVTVTFNSFATHPWAVAVGTEGVFTGWIGGYTATSASARGFEVTVDGDQCSYGIINLGRRRRRANTKALSLGGFVNSNKGDLSNLSSRIMERWLAK